MNLNLSSAMSSYLKNNGNNQAVLNTLIQVDKNKDTLSNTINSTYSDNIDINDNKLSNSLKNSNQNISLFDKYTKNINSISDLLINIKELSNHIIVENINNDDIESFKNEIIININKIDQISSQLPKETIVLNAGIDYEESIEITIENFNSKDLKLDEIYTLNNFKQGFKGQENLNTFQTKDYTIDVKYEDRIEKKTIQVPLNKVNMDNIEQQAEILLAIVNNAMQSINENEKNISDVVTQLENITRKILMLRSNIKNTAHTSSDIDYTNETSVFSKLNILSREGSFISAQINNLNKKRVQELIAS